MQTHAQLQDALQEMRQRYAPFLAELAPALESMRQTVTLSDFRWKREEDTCWQTVSLPHYGAPLGNASTQYETEFTLGEIPAGRRVFVVVNGADVRDLIYSIVADIRRVHSLQGLQAFLYRRRTVAAHHTFNFHSFLHNFSLLFLYFYFFIFTCVTYIEKI